MNDDTGGTIRPAEAADNKWVKVSEEEYARLVSEYNEALRNGSLAQVTRHPRCFYTVVGKKSGETEHSRFE